MDFFYIVPTTKQHPPLVPRDRGNEYRGLYFHFYFFLCQLSSCGTYRNTFFSYNRKKHPCVPRSNWLGRRKKPNSLTYPKTQNLKFYTRQFSWGFPGSLTIPIQDQPYQCIFSSVETMFQSGVGLPSADSWCSCPKFYKSFLNHGAAFLFKTRYSVP